jgi:recombination protein RecT
MESKNNPNATQQAPAMQPQAPVTQPAQPQAPAQQVAQPQPAQPQAQVLPFGYNGLKMELANPSTLSSFTKILGPKRDKFISALLSIVGSNTQFNNVSAKSIILAAGQSAAMDLPLNPSLGMAAVIPYKGVAQLQVMRDGWIELCLRSGKIAKIVNETVYEGELVSHNRFTGEYIFDESKRVSNKIIGFMAYAKTTSGFEKTIYWTREECYAHGQRYSKTFNYDTSKWKSDFEAMAKKTVLKNLIKKYLPKSTEMELAIASDQAAFEQGEIGNAAPVYVDNDGARTESAGGRYVSHEKAEVIDVNAEEVQDAQAVPVETTQQAAPAQTAPQAAEGKTSKK